MTDYRSLERLDVFRRDERVATLTRLPKGCEFRYEPAFLASVEIPIALQLPKTPEPIVSEGLLNLPTYFAGLLPEGVMFAAAQTLIGSSRDDLFAVLAATARDTIGDIDVRVPGAPSAEPSPPNLEKAREALEAILDRRGGQVEDISAISGAQPKMSIGGIVRSHRSPTYIAKFPPRGFPGLPENEAACMTLARKCGLRAPRVKVENNVYIVLRFDRGVGGDKLHVEDMLQVMDLFPNSKYALGYVEICEAMANLGVSRAGILEAIKLYAFSYMVGNGDLHGKNVSLIRKPDGQWIPSPCYDIVSTLPYKAQLPGAENMALALADDSIGRFELGEFTEFGKRFSIPEKATQNSITALARAVQKLGRSILSTALPEEDVDIVLGRAESLIA